MTKGDVYLDVNSLTVFGARVLGAVGCTQDIAKEVADHLVAADLAGVYSHGIFRLTQYAEQAREGRYRPEASPEMVTVSGGGCVIDGNEGFGIPAMHLATQEGIRQARESGMSAIGVRNVAHTGRLGEFTECAAEAGCLAIIFGGGARRDWPQVAPFGGTQGKLPTNPYSFALPGGDGGPVVLDFATSAGAGGKIYAAKSAGRSLPEGLCIDRHGAPTTNPDDYFNGGALLPMAGPKGYGMALLGELMGEAVFGASMDGLNWVCIYVDLARFQDGSRYTRIAEEILSDVRTCPPAPGFECVEIPGERERRLRRERLETGIPIPVATLGGLNQTARKLGVSTLTQQ